MTDKTPAGPDALAEKVERFIEGETNCSLSADELREIAIALRSRPAQDRDAERYEKKWKACQALCTKLLNFFQPITKEILWARVDQFGDEYNKELETIDAAMSQQEGK